MAASVRRDDDGLLRRPVVPFYQRGGQKSALTISKSVFGNERTRLSPPPPVLDSGRTRQCGIPRAHSGFFFFVRGGLGLREGQNKIIFERKWYFLLYRTGFR